MTRRSNGEGGLHWDEGRQRWIATVTTGYDGRGKRTVRKAAGRTKTEAKARLRDLLHDRDEGLSESSCTRPPSGGGLVNLRLRAARA